MKEQTDTFGHSRRLPTLTQHAIEAFLRESVCSINEDKEWVTTPHRENKYAGCATK